MISHLNFLSVLFPKLGKYLAKYGIVDFFSSTSLNFLKQVSESIIERRRAKLEVSHYEETESMI